MGHIEAANHVPGACDSAEQRQAHQAQPLVLALSSLVTELLGRVRVYVYLENGMQHFFKKIYVRLRWVLIAVQRLV